MLLFNRQASIIIGQEGPTGVLIDGLRIAFNITKTITPAKNQASVTVYNLSSETRAQTEEANANVTLKVGYGETQEIIFYGNIVRSVSMRNGADMVTTLDLGDGSKALAETFVSETFTAGSTVDQVIGQLSRSFGLPVKELPGNIGEAFASGLSLVGPAKKALEDLASSYGFDFSIQDGEVQLLPHDVLSSDEAVYLSSDTGLLGVPEKLTGDDKYLPKDNSIKFTGVRAMSLLNPKIRPGGLIQIDSRFVKDDFKAEKVTHAGDTHGPEWHTTVEAKSI